MTSRGVFNKAGILPTRNWQTEVFDEVEGITGETMKEKVVKGHRACFACSINCTKYSVVPSGPYKSIINGPDYETVYGFGSICCVDSIEALCKADEIGDEYGIDLRFGNADAMLAMTEKIGKREGLGALLCHLGEPLWGPLRISENAYEAVNAATGWNLTYEDARRIAERQWNMIHCCSAREGFTRNDDRLPVRFMEEPVPDGPMKGSVITREPLERLKDDYHTYRGWDLKTGNPAPEKLTELGLEFAIPDLYGKARSLSQHEIRAMPCRPSRRPESGVTAACPLTGACRPDSGSRRCPIASGSRCQRSGYREARLAWG